MKKKITTFISFMFALTAVAQTEGSINLTFDSKEDSLNSKTVDDIINEQQEVTARRATGRHFSDVWGKNKFWNISYNSASLTPKETILTGVVDHGGIVPDFKSNWGFSVQFGRNFRLHKTPIANTVQLNIDWTFIDLNVNHFSADGMYDSGVDRIDISSNKNVYSLNENVLYAPWNMEKYEANYGMSLGLSATIAPFNYVNAAWLHYLKFNLFYHIGYHASVLNMKYDELADLNTYRIQLRDEYYQNELETIKNMPEGVEKEDAKKTLALEMQNDKVINSKAPGSSLMFGHGMMQSFGFSVSWKAIGFGYECRLGQLKYKSTSSSTFGSDEYKFKTATNRIFIQFRL